MSQTKLAKLMEEYVGLKIQVDSLDDQMKTKKEEIAIQMHKDGIPEFFAEVDGEKWTGVYQTSERNSCDYALLLEQVGQKIYNTIVTTKPSTALVIRKAKKTKSNKDDLTKQAPGESKSVKPGSPKAQVNIPPFKAVIS